MGPELLGRLLDQYAAPLELYARQLCACPDDVVQEAFVELAKRRQSPDDVAAWLYRVVRNKAISASRSARRRKHYEAAAAEQRQSWFKATADNALDAESAAAALETLASEGREVVVARVWGGLTFQQIARLVGTSDSTAHRRYEAALSILRDRLGIRCPKND